MPVIQRHDLIELRNRHMRAKPPIDFSGVTECPHESLEPRSARAVSKLGAPQNQDQGTRALGGAGNDRLQLGVGRRDGVRVITFGKIKVEIIGRGMRGKAAAAGLLEDAIQRTNSPADHFSRAAFRPQAISERRCQGVVSSLNFWHR
jgi:hypothetical protein